MILMLRDHLIIDSAESARPLKLLPEAEYKKRFFSEELPRVAKEPDP
jgi:hypothetical protein